MAKKNLAAIMKADAKKDKKLGIKEGSARDKAMDKKAGFSDKKQNAMFKAGKLGGKKASAKGKGKKRKPSIPPQFLSKKKGK